MLLRKGLRLPARSFIISQFMKMRNQFFAAVTIAVCLLGGCRMVDLHHNLEEIEADEILVTLNQHGIDAKKVKEVAGQDVSWNVLTNEKDLAAARQILLANNLPRRRELGLSGVYKEKGLIPTPDEQKARFLLALKGEIINSLRKIPGVVDADVVLNVPSESEFDELDPVKKRPTASVVVRTRNDEQVAQMVTEGKLQRFVANSVQNLDPNNVSVIVTRIDSIASSAVAERLPLPPPPLAVPGGQAEGDLEGATRGEGHEAVYESGEMVDLAGLKLDAASVKRFKAYIIGLLSVLGVVSFFLLFNIVRLNRMRVRVQRGKKLAQPVIGGAGDATRGLLGEGAGLGGSAMEGTFDVGSDTRAGG